jgi:hypothetical protein
MIIIPSPVLHMFFHRALKCAIGLTSEISVDNLGNARSEASGNFRKKKKRLNI